MPKPCDSCLLILDSLYGVSEVRIVPYQVYCILEEASTQGLPSELEDLVASLGNFPDVPFDDVVQVPKFDCIRIVKI